MPTKFLLVLALLFGSAAFAQNSEYLPDAAQEARANSLFRDIRCVVCAGQSIHDSNSIIAHDMRMEVRKQILRGAKDREIKAYLVERYGDSILMTPPLQGSTALLWIAPVVLLGSGAAIAFYQFRRRQRHRA